MPGALKRAPSRFAPSVIEDEDETALGRILEDGVSLAIWSRPALPDLAGWLDGLPPERLPDGRFTATPTEVPARLSMLCDLVELEDCPARSRLVEDVSALAVTFARVAGATRVDLRLEALDHDGCWRFHRDHVGLRLNATYRGPGTQWPPLDRAAQALRAQRRYRGALNELPRFAVGLFKGVPLAGPEAIVHRSPPLAGSGVTRLFLCINEELGGD